MLGVCARNRSWLRTKAALVSFIAMVSTADGQQCPESSPYDPWRDLLDHEPSDDDYDDRSEDLGNPDFDFQSIDGEGDLRSNMTNLDDFSVRIDQIPPRFDGPESFFDDIRRNFGSFVDTDLATFDGMSDGSNRAWSSPGPAPLGSMHVFDINGPFFVREQAGVMTTRSSSTSWTFTTITSGDAMPGEHPVSGNREFGIRRSNDGYEIYTRGADRVTPGPIETLLDISGLFTVGDTYAGGGDLWRAWQQAIADYVNENGGSASVNEPVVLTPEWNSDEFERFRACSGCIQIDDIESSEWLCNSWKSSVERILDFWDWVELPEQLAYSIQAVEDACGLKLCPISQP